MAFDSFEDFIKPWAKLNGIYDYVHKDKNVPTIAEISVLPYFDRMRYMILLENCYITSSEEKVDKEIEEFEDEPYSLLLEWFAGTQYRNSPY